MQESAENYLETILILSYSGQPIRSVDIANELRYTRPSVSVAMKNLKSSGHILIDAKGFITLTERGREIAGKMYDRHTMISDWLIFLGVDKDTAVSDACKIEHDISERSYLALKEHIEGWKRGVYKQKLKKGDKPE